MLLNGVGFLTAMYGANFGAVMLECKPFDPSSSRTQDRILLYLGYTYYVSKYIDFLDTVYFVLRKKQSHVSGLHVVSGSDHTRNRARSLTYAIN